MFHPQNPSDLVSTVADPAAPPSPIPHFRTPELQLPENLAHLPGKIPNLPHLPSPHLPVPPSPGLLPPASPAPGEPVGQKKGLLNRLKLPKLLKSPKVKAPILGDPTKLKVRKRTRIKLYVTKLKAKMGLGAKVPSTKGVTAAVPAQVPVEAPSPRL